MSFIEKIRLVAENLYLVLPEREVARRNEIASRYYRLYIESPHRHEAVFTPSDLLSQLDIPADRLFFLTMLNRKQALVVTRAMYDQFQTGRMKQALETLLKYREEYFDLGYKESILELLEDRLNSGTTSLDREQLFMDFIREVTGITLPYHRISVTARPTRKMND